MAHNNDLTSSLQNHVICDYCENLYTSKNVLVKHIKACRGANSRKCKWCKLTFKNRGNLVTHTIAIHGDYSVLSELCPWLNGTENKYSIENRMELESSISNQSTSLNFTDDVNIDHKKSLKSECNFECQVCEKKFSHRFHLTNHIRRTHFNLQGKTPYCELKRVNQVWFENVLNTNNVLEIKKTGHNTLVMRKLDPNTGIKVSDANLPTIDLSSVYPIYNRSKEKVECQICKKMYLKITIKKHMDEKHSEVTKHQCNNCNRTFKRAYFFLRHICHKVRKRGKQPIRIEQVESLTPIKIS